MGQNVLNAILNFILVSIPEEAFIVVMTLILLKRFDLLDVRMWRQNLKWLMIPTLPVVFFINLFRYVIIIPRSLASLITYILMILLILYIVLKNSYLFKKMIIFKVFIFTTLSFAIVGLIELAYYPIVLSILDKPIEYFNNIIILNFLLSIPTRVIQLCIILFITTKKNNEVKVNLFDTILKNKVFTNSFITMLVLIISVIMYATKLLMINNILLNMNIIDQLFIVVILTSTPIILVTWFLMFVNYLLKKEKQIQQTYENLIIQDNVMTDVENKD
jgi:hypothetical protein